MEHGRFSYSAVVDRPPLRWPNGARLALWIVPNIEYLRFDELLRSSAPRTIAPDIINYAPFDYGNRVAIWRIMALLDRFNIRATVALNGDVCDVYKEDRGGNRHTSARLARAGARGERADARSPQRSGPRLRRRLGQRRSALSDADRAR